MAEKKEKVKAVMVRILEDEYPTVVEKIKELKKDHKFKNEDGTLNSRDVRELLGLRPTRNKTGVKSQIAAKIKELNEEDQKKLLDDLSK